MGVCTTKLISTLAVGVIVYASSIVQGASQVADSVAIPKTSWEKLGSAISGVAEALRAIRPAQASTQSVQTTSPPASTTANQVVQESELPATTT
jgi:type IV secretory pathway TrbL component